MASNEEDPQLVNCTKTSHGDDEEDTIGEPEIKCDREALKMAEKLLEYSRFNGKEKLSLRQRICSRKWLFKTKNNRELTISY